ncbi:MAG TPA: ABC transporter ATP-binding protein [Blastocatellia bacterium]|nr:ABC transporter ATP-binding protein [Blastocatellia bacterium]
MSWRVVLVLTLMLSLGLIEGIGLILLIPLLGLTGIDVQQGAVGAIDSFVASAFNVAGLRPTLMSVLAVYVAITIAHSLLQRWQTVSSASLENEFVDRLRQRLYKSITNANWLFFSRSKASHFTHALTSELDRVDIATYSLLAIVVNCVVASVYIILALRLSVPMTVLVFACGAALLLLLKGKMRKARLSGEALSDATGEMHSSSLEHFGGIKVVKAYNAERRNIKIFSELTRRVTRIYDAYTRDHANMKLWFDVGAVLVLAVILYVSIGVASMPAAGVLVLIFLFARIMPKLSTIQQNYQRYVHALPAFAAVMDVESRCLAASDPAPTDTEPVQFRQSVRLDRVDFEYEPGGFRLQALDLTIAFGDMTAIVGQSGAGKSTIADLLLGLVAPGRGRVLIDDAVLEAKLIKGWRDQIGYVAQDTFLFHDTVRANLLWARPEATEQELWDALRLAAADEFVKDLPQRLETVLGDRGVRLSGGERQRIALARALLRKPQLLILDEATSALDSENEKRILSAIEELHGRLTILVIAHRLSTIRTADHIYLIERGRLIEHGDWSSLITREGGRFQAFFKAQNLEVVPDTQKVSYD